ncbi:hypothetical protein TNIN_226811 [Trichonephila inaurata madagascariensis]|uniref:Uncharacterized protein n=1 Tax=Trichonephila inaurata madagascariensis TaxID=2747483 RepID=A0A8X6WYR4_9ARAC|nr:hypothetical protein TNIN_226811 [Trichonephila inaurata madagascariensis]
MKAADNGWQLFNHHHTDDADLCATSCAVEGAPSTWADGPCVSKLQRLLSARYGELFSCQMLRTTKFLGKLLQSCSQVFVGGVLGLGILVPMSGKYVAVSGISKISRNKYRK